MWRNKSFIWVILTLYLLNNIRPGDSMLRKLYVQIRSAGLTNNRGKEGSWVQHRCETRNGPRGNVTWKKCSSVKRKRDCFCSLVLCDILQIQITLFCTVYLYVKHMKCPCLDQKLLHFDHSFCLKAVCPLVTTHCKGQPAWSHSGPVDTEPTARQWLWEGAFDRDDRKLQRMPSHFLLSTGSYIQEYGENIPAIFWKYLMTIKECRNDQNEPVILWGWYATYCANKAPWTCYFKANSSLSRWK